MVTFGSIRQLASYIRGRYDVATRAGITFAGARNTYEALGYPTSLDLVQYRQRFQRGDISARIVEAFPLATWRGGAELVEDDDPDITTAFEQAWGDLNERLKVWTIFSRADVLAGLGHYSVILIGAPGNLHEELPPTLKADDIVYLQPYAEDEAKVLTFDDDAASARFGLPLTYQIKRTGRNLTVERNVHWTRVLHVADGVLDDNINGRPRLEKVWNRLDDLDKVLGGGSEAFWRRAHQGLIFNFDPEMEIDPDDEKKMEAAADEFAHDLRRTLATRGMTVEKMGSDVADFGPQADALLTIIAGATGIPKRILVGSERGELASTQDKTNWDERIAERRKEYAEQTIVRPFIQRLQEHKALPPTEDYEVRWPELIQLDENEKATIALKWAGVNKAAGETVIRGNEIRDRVLNLEPLSDEEIEELKPPPPVVVPPVPGQPPEEEPPVEEPKAAAGKDQPRENLGGDGSSALLTHVWGGTKH